ncbi:hypothetical protein AVEN_77823-1 [Araneus ventricosus]|uniref:Transposon Ty3-I Gag-Pol polyprotein n=1 Tax=Araneus ventricosus TaxID=182803 RepID=A0A4Y2GMZ9_ARAVE|nr:hypothetical protein AVEN_77823-1 [Araneus ventricosus]
MFWMLDCLKTYNRSVVTDSKPANLADDDENTLVRFRVKNCDVTFKLSFLSEPLTEFTKIASEFPSITNPSLLGKQTKSTVVLHHIEPTGSPVYFKPGRFKPELLKAAKKEFERLMTLEIFCRSKSPLSNPFHMVKKANGGWRSCGDYSCLNAMIVPNRYPVPYIQDCTQLLESKTIFSTIYLSRAYNQIVVFPDDITKTEMTTVCLSMFPCLLDYGMLEKIFNDSLIRYHLV